MGARTGGLIGRMGPLAVAIAAAMWATDPYFRPALTKQLTASQIVFVESLLIALCFLPVAGRVRRELRHLPLRQWVAMGVIALGAQAFATVLFTQALSYAFPAHAPPRPAPPPGPCAFRPGPTPHPISTSKTRCTCSTCCSRCSASPWRAS